MGSARKTLLNPVGSYSKSFLCYAVLFSNRTLIFILTIRARSITNYHWTVIISPEVAIIQNFRRFPEMYFMWVSHEVFNLHPHILTNLHKQTSGRFNTFFFINISNGSHTFRNFYNTEVKKILKKWDNGLYCRKPETCFRIISYLLFFNKGRTHLFRLRQKNTKTRFVVDVMD